MHEMHMSTHVELLQCKWNPCREWHGAPMLVRPVKFERIKGEDFSPRVRAGGKEGTKTHTTSVRAMVKRRQPKRLQKVEDSYARNSTRMRAYDHACTTQTCQRSSKRGAHQCDATRKIDVVFANNCD